MEVLAKRDNTEIHIILRTPEERDAMYRLLGSAGSNQSFTIYCEASGIWVDSYSNSQDIIYTLSDRYATAFSKVWRPR